MTILQIIVVICIAQKVHLVYFHLFPFFFSCYQIDAGAADVAGLMVQLAEAYAIDDPSLCSFLSQAMSALVREFSLLSTIAVKLRYFLFLPYSFSFLKNHFWLAVILRSRETEITFFAWA